MGCNSWEKRSSTHPRGKPQCRKSSLTIFYLGGRLTHSSPRLHFPGFLAALINFRRELGYLFYFSRNKRLLGIDRVCGGSLSSGCGVCLEWKPHSEAAGGSQTLPAAIPGGQRGGRLRPEFALAEILETGANSTKRIPRGTTFPRRPCGNRAAFSLASVTLGLLVRCSAR